MRISLFLLLLHLVIPMNATNGVPQRHLFLQPPSAARPQVWWHWMNGNISAEGIRKDLLWMHEIGIGGIHLFDANLSTPQIVPQRIEYMTAPWQACFRQAIHMADSLQMEVTLPTAAGWSNTGGPWVTPEDAMKRITWRDTLLMGGQTHHCALPAPYTVSGTYQQVRSVKRSRQVPYYRDLYVLALRTPNEEVNMCDMVAQVQAHKGTFQAALLYDDDLETMQQLPAEPKQGKAWLSLTLHKAYCIKAIQLATSPKMGDWGIELYNPKKYLESSQDGIHFTKVCDIPNGYAPLQTLSIPPTTARHFRLVCQCKKGSVGIAELKLCTTDRVHHAEEKAGFAGVIDIALQTTPQHALGTPLQEVLDITSHVDAQGHLHWQAPEGKWHILRFGYALTGKENHPASPEATGLEVDKYDSAAVHRYFEHYLAIYQRLLGDSLMGKRGLRALLMDSYEAGFATWTSRMREAFRNRRGYDLLPWLPAMAGYIVESPAATDQFLYDYRQTLADLITDNLFRQTNDIAHRHGLQLYAEGMEDKRPFIGDGMLAKSFCDIPMAAQWARSGMYPFKQHTFVSQQADMRESASVAHLYGRPLVAAETFTAYGPERKDSSAYNFYPGNLKQVADLAFASGINRVVIHEVAHQPSDNHRPGLTLGIYGQWFSRHETWAAQARPWIDYLARSSYLLQQGTAVADIAYFYGEESNAAARYGKKLPALPSSVAYDFVNPTALTQLLHVENGKLTTASGMRYRLLALDPQAKVLSMPTLQALHRLVQEGAMLCGNAPIGSLGQRCDTVAFRQLVADIWHRGRSNVFPSKALSTLVDSLFLPDVSCYNMDSIRYVHRQTAEADIYWVNNRSTRTCSDVFRFRLTGKRPMLWHPVSGNVTPISYSIGTQTTYVPLTLQPGEAVFIVFHGKPHKDLRHTEPTPKGISRKLCFTKPWTVQFPPESGAPSSIVLDSLRSLSALPLLARDTTMAHNIRYFSGTATYHNSLHITKTDTLGCRFLLHLGQVAHLAEIIVNDKTIGILWTNPFSIDITSALREGDNTVTIKVTNTWKNRLIGDRLQPANASPHTFTSYTWSKKPTQRLEPSGLIGPVELHVITLE